MGTAGFLIESAKNIFKKIIKMNYIILKTKKVLIMKCFMDVIMMIIWLESVI